MFARHYLHWPTTRVSRFKQSERGMTLPLVAISFLAIVGFTGSAIDIARIQLVQARLSSALDAAGLAAGSTMDTTYLSTEINTYVHANFPTGYMGASAPSANAVLSDNNMVINLTANTSVPTAFMQIFGLSAVNVSATSQITRTASGLEVVMVLDNTGSMANSGKITALKTSAASLVNILFGGKDTAKNLWIGLVPFSQTVNIGTGHSSWMDSAFMATLNWGPTSWLGCVEARTNGYDVTDAPPSVQKIRPFYFPSTDNRAAPNNSSDQLQANKWVRQRDANGNPTKYATNISSTTTGPNYLCPQQMLPMTASRSPLITSINNMNPVGATHVGFGLVWGFRMISPLWRNLWGGEMDANSLPLDYNTPHMSKAVILLTDGENTFVDTTFTAYRFLSDGRLGTTNETSAVNELNNRLTTTCTTMKKKGIYLYTIVLGNPTNQIKTLMKSCASSENYYFLSPTADQLNSVFNTIADSLSNLRISK